MIPVDLPWNLEEDWKLPEFRDGEMAELAKQVGVELIASQRTLIGAGLRINPSEKELKRAIACHRLGHLFQTNRQTILNAIGRRR